MRKNKLLLAIVGLLLGLATPGWADDVTSTYITNPSFENDDVSELTEKTESNTFRGYEITAPTGWTVENPTDLDKSLIVNKDCDTDNGFGLVSTIPDGTYAYYLRMGWHTGTSTISQTLQNLPVGNYTLTVDVRTGAKSGVTSSFVLSAGSTSNSSVTFNNGSLSDWTTQTLNFSVEEAGDVEIKLAITWGSGGSCIMIDNFTLTYSATDKSALLSAITDATALNAILNNTTLTSAISDAQTVYDNTSASQDDIDDAVTTLNSAVDALAVTSITSGDYYLQNVGASAYLAKGGNWGSHATVDGAGQAITVTKLDDGTYTLHMVANNEGTVVGSAGWTDAKTGRSENDYTVWKIYEVSDGYVLRAATSGTANEGGFLYWTKSTVIKTDPQNTKITYRSYNWVDCSTEATTDNASYWKFVKKDDRQAYTSGTVASPFDVTYLLANPDFEIGSLTSWTNSGFSKQTNGEHGTGDYGEKWSSGALSTALSIKQTLSSLPAGSYKLTANAFATISGAASTGAYLYAGEETTELGTSNTYEVLFAANGSDNVEIGIKTDKSVTANWVAFDQFRLYYIGSEVIQLVATDYESGDVTPDADSWYAYTPEESASYTVTSGISYTYNGEQNTDSYTADGTTTGTMTMKAGTTYYFLVPASTTFSITKAGDVVADGTYYLYNETNKAFMSRGAAWGTEAVIDKYGLPVTVTMLPEGTYTLQFVDNSMYLFRPSDDGGPSTGATTVYTDNNYNNTWNINTVDGGYTISYNDGTDDYNIALGTGNYGYYLYTNANDAAVVWTLKTTAERNEIIENYPTENKTDVATSLETEDLDTYIASCSTEDIELSDWTWNGVRTQKDQPATGTNYVEAWQATGNWTQTLTDLNEGLYKISIAALDRHAGYDSDTNLDATYGSLSTSYIAANGEQARIINWSAVHAASGDATANYPDNPTQGVACFEANNATNEVYAYVGEDGKLELKIAKPGHVDNCWMLWGTVTVTKYTANEITLDETADDSETLTANNGKTAIVTLKRTINKDVYNAICLPFDVDAETIAEVFGEGAEVAQYNSDTYNSTSEKMIIDFKKSETIEAGVPYLIYSENAYSTENPLTFEGVTISNELKPVSGTNYNFVGNFANGQEVVQYDIVITAKGNLSVRKTTTTLKGYRSYFEATTEYAKQARSIDVNIGGETTSISSISGLETESGDIYNLRGQKVNNTQKGVYIQNGKKVVIK